MYEEKYKDSYKRVELPKEKEPFLHLDCPSCSTKISASDININDKIAKCNSCDAIFSFEETIKTHIEKTEELKKPVGVDKIYFGEELEMSINQPLGVIAAIALSAFPFVTLMSSLVYFKKESLTAAIIALISTAIFVFYLVRTIKTRKDKIFFNCYDQKLNIEWENDKLKRTKSFFRSEMEQFYVARTANGIALKVILNTNEGQVHKVLVDGMKSVIELKYLEQEIEQYYGLPNKKIASEIH